MPGRLGQVSDDQKERQGVDHQEGKGSQIVRPLSGKMTQNSPQEYGRANRRSWKYCVGHKKGPAPFDVEPTPDRRFLLCSDCVSAALLPVFTVAFVLWFLLRSPHLSEMHHTVLSACFCPGVSCAPHHVSVMLSAVFASASHTVSPVIHLCVHEAYPQCLPSHFLKHLHYIACRRKRGLGKVLVLSYELLF